MTTKHMITLKSKATCFDGEKLLHVSAFVGKLVLNLSLADADRLRLIEFLTNARPSVSVELHSIGPLMLSTGGVEYMQITPDVLGIDEVEVSG